MILRSTRKLLIVQDGGGFEVNILKYTFATGFFFANTPTRMYKFLAQNTGLGPGLLLDFRVIFPGVLKSYTALSRARAGSSNRNE